MATKQGTQSSNIEKVMIFGKQMAKKQGAQWYYIEKVMIFD